MKIYIGSDNLLRIEGLRNAAAGGTYINNATVTATLYRESDGAAVSGQSWPATLTYVAASDGDYEGILEDGLALVRGERYYAEVVADAGSGNLKTWRPPLIAAYAER